MGILCPSAQQCSSPGDGKATAPNSCQMPSLPLPTPAPAHVSASAKTSNQNDQLALNCTNSRVKVSWELTWGCVSGVGISTADVQGQQPLQKAQQKPKEDVSMALTHCIYLKVSNVDLENRLRFRPLPLTRIACAAFRNSTRIQRTGRFIKSCLSKSLPYMSANQSPKWGSQNRQLSGWGSLPGLALMAVTESQNHRIVRGWKGPLWVI